MREIDGNAVNLVPAKTVQECAIPLADFLPGGVIGGKFRKFVFDRTHLTLSLSLRLRNANVATPASLPMPIADGEVQPHAAPAEAAYHGLTQGDFCERQAMSRDTIFRYFEAHLDSHVSKIQELVRQPSVSLAPSENGKIAEIFCRNLDAFLAGRPNDMINALDKQRRY